MKQTTDRTRIFFALLPDPKTVRAIDFHAAQLSPHNGRKVVPENYHITLRFLGNVAHQTIDALCLDCDAILSESFSITLDKTGWWQKPKIFWLAPSVTPPSLTALVNSVSTMAARRGIEGDNKRYFPHITLMRNVSEVPVMPVIKPFNWTATDYCLMQSITRPQGVQYRELARWALGK